MDTENVNIVFIGGTGRCGTNILKDIFAQHSEVATLPFEHRFFIDPDGLVDFYSSYSQSWSPFLADKRFKRLERFLKEVNSVNKFHRVFKRTLSLFKKKGISVSPKRYCDWELGMHFPNFEIHNKWLLHQLREFTFNGLWPGTESYGLKPSVDHCPWVSKEKLAVIMGSYINRLISDLLLSRKSGFFVEDNTWNIFFSKELLELLPQAKIIHIYRDPRDVVASFANQRWCPSDKIKAARWYESMMSYWLYSVRRDLPESSYIEIQLESLVESPESVLKLLCEFLDLPFEKSLINIDLSKSNSGRWKKEFSNSDKKAIFRILDPIISELGYM